MRPTHQRLKCGTLLGAVAFILACDRAPTDERGGTSAARQTPPLGIIEQAAPMAFAPDDVYAIGDLPRRDPDLPAGAGREVIERQCILCHSTTYIAGQPPLSEASWRATLDKMVHGYGASLTQGELEAALVYLGAQFGPQRHDAAKQTGPDGGAVYQQACVMCHQPTGLGVPGAFPPLAGHVSELARDDAGRRYLIGVLLYGVAGALEIDGRAYNSIMPPLGGRLRDDEVAAVLNHVIAAWPSAVEGRSPPKQVLPAEVESMRKTPLTPQQSRERRPM